MFVVSITYTSSLEQIDSYLDEHVAFLDKQYGLGNFLLSGRKVPRTGGVIISSLSSKAELGSVLELDPFYREHLATYEITEILPTKAAPGLESLIKN